MWRGHVVKQQQLFRIKKRLLVLRMELRVDSATKGRPFISWYREVGTQVEDGARAKTAVHNLAADQTVCIVPFSLHLADQSAFDKHNFGPPIIKTIFGVITPKGNRQKCKQGATLTTYRRVGIEPTYTTVARGVRSHFGTGGLSGGQGLNLLQPDPQSGVQPHELPPDSEEARSVRSGPLR